MQDRICDRKNRYFNQGDAEYAAARTQELNVMTRHHWHPIVAYQCPYGEHWHIGHEVRAKEGL
jgi:hypothetical protein